MRIKFVWLRVELASILREDADADQIDGMSVFIECAIIKIPHPCASIDPVLISSLIVIVPVWMTQ
jgi:hypothetical protein